MRWLRLSIGVIVYSLCSLCGAQDFRVTLLGSGENYPQPGRMGPSILVEAGDQTYVFDAGRGAIHRFVESGAAFDELDAVFFTHLHSDHVVGFPGLWLGGWLWSVRDYPLRVFGPVGTSNMIEHLTEAFSFDIGIRTADDGAAPGGARIEVTEVEDGFIWRDGGVEIRDIEVDHRPVKPAFGYRVDYYGRSVAMSGDTRYSEAFIDAAKDVDLVIHEVSDASDAFLAEIVMAHHTRADEAGRVFSQVSPKLAVYAHMVMGDMSILELVEKTRTTYSGPLVVGEDLMTFDIGSDVSVATRSSALTFD
jgi:ribonuclease Z